MAARSLQSVTITFGLVTIPVKLYAATNPRAGISFTMLDANGGRVKQQYIRPSPEKSFRATRWSKVMNSKRTALSPSPRKN